MILKLITVLLHCATNIRKSIMDEVHIFMKENAIEQLRGYEFTKIIGGLGCQ